jgi:hypothetical protein
MSRNNVSISWLMLGSAVGGAALALGIKQLLFTNKAKKRDPETDYSVAHELIWNGIGGAFSAAMMYTGDRLDLYKVLREECKSSDSAAVTAIDLAEVTVRI